MVLHDQQSNLGVINPQTVEKAAKIIKAIGAVIGKIFNARTQARELNKQKAQLDNALKVLREANKEADVAIESLSSEIQQLSGLSGHDLDGFGTWLKKTFAPAKYAKDELNKTIDKYNSTFPQLESALNQKLQILEQMKAELERLQTGSPIAVILGLLGLTAMIGFIVWQNSEREPESKASKHVTK